jgi:hypothetical protein
LQCPSNALLLIIYSSFAPHGVQNLVHSDRSLGLKALAVQLNLDEETVKGLELWPYDWILHHDNAPAHKAFSAHQFLAQKLITEVKYPPCSHCSLLNSLKYMSLAIFFKLYSM